MEILSQMIPLFQIVYKMSAFPRGRAIILNIMNFEGCPEDKREGSNIDAWRLALLFQQLGFDVMKWNDLSSQVSEKTMVICNRDPSLC